MRAMGFAVISGVTLGVLSRLDELNGPPVEISTNVTWLGTAILLGACGATLKQGMWQAVVGLTAANLAYYLYRLMDDTSLERVAHHAPKWLIIGVITGVVFGAAGRGARVVSGSA